MSERLCERVCVSEYESECECERYIRVIERNILLEQRRKPTFWNDDDTFYATQRKFIESSRVAKLHCILDRWKNSL